MTGDGGERPAGAYSPGRRTALVLCGTGAHGAYLAGALRAIQEAGIRIDLVAGHGIGAATAALAAIDGGSRLWDADGIWHSRIPSTLYTWKPALRAAGWLVVILGAVLAIPLIVFAAALAVYAIAFLLALAGLEAGTALTQANSGWLQAAFSPAYLPTTVPRLAVIVVVLLGAVLAAGALLPRWHAPLRRHVAGAWWWEVLGAPIDATAARAVFSDAIWQLVRGAAPQARPAAEAVGRRYAEVLAESIGQPGFRELIAVASDLDARRDVVLALVREPYHAAFLSPVPGRDRRSEVLDLAGAGRDRALDVLAAALTPPAVADPALLGFSLDSLWRGETHRLCDRPGASHRLLEEVATAGISQVVVVSAAAPTLEPHRLSPPRLDPRHRLGEYLTSAECIALRDALEMARLRFDAIHVVRPAHNPVGPFDLRGVYDQASDRFQNLAELMARGYEDAYRQFVEPVVGASGEHLRGVR